MAGGPVCDVDLLFAVVLEPYRDQGVGETGVGLGQDVRDVPVDVALPLLETGGVVEHDRDLSDALPVGLASLDKLPLGRSLKIETLHYTVKRH